MKSFQRFQTTADYSNGNQTKEQKARDGGVGASECNLQNICMYTYTQEDSTYTHTHVHTLFSHFFVGGKVFNSLPAKITEKNLLPSPLIKNVRKLQENCKRYLGDDSQF